MQIGTKQLLLSNFKAWLQSSVLLSKAMLFVESTFAAITDQVAERFIQADFLAGAESEWKVRVEISEFPSNSKLFWAELSNLWVTNLKILLNAFYHP